MRYQVSNQPARHLGGEVRKKFPLTSHMRQVPDNQEVFAHKSSDQSIIFDILEYVNECEDDKAIE